MDVVVAGVVCYPGVTSMVAPEEGETEREERGKRWRRRKRERGLAFWRERHPVAGFIEGKGGW